MEVLELERQRQLTLMHRSIKGLKTNIDLTNMVCFLNFTITFHCFIMHTLPYAVFWLLCAVSCVLFSSRRMCVIGR